MNGIRLGLIVWWVAILAILVGNNLSRAAGGPSFNIGVYNEYLLGVSILSIFLMAINGAEIMAFIVAGALVAISFVSGIVYLAQLSTFDNFATEMLLRLILIIAGLPGVMVAKSYLK